MSDGIAVGEVDVALSVSDLSRSDLVDVAVAADRLGFGCLWLAEGIGPVIMLIQDLQDRSLTR